MSVTLWISQTKRLFIMLISSFCCSPTAAAIGEETPAPLWISVSCFILRPPRFWILPFSFFLFCVGSTVANIVVVFSTLTMMRTSQILSKRDVLFGDSSWSETKNNIKVLLKFSLWLVRCSAATAVVHAMKICFFAQSIFTWQGSKVSSFTSPMHWPRIRPPHKRRAVSVILEVSLFSSFWRWLHTRFPHARLAFTSVRSKFETPTL